MRNKTEKNKLSLFSILSIVRQDTAEHSEALRIKNGEKPMFDTLERTPVQSNALISKS